MTAEVIVVAKGEDGKPIATLTLTREAAGVFMTYRDRSGRSVRLTAEQGHKLAEWLAEIERDGFPKETRTLIL
jgi:hypothetical protein